MYKVTLGICALVEMNGTVQLIKKSLENGVSEIILVTPNPQIEEEIKRQFATYNVKIIKEVNRRGKAVAINQILKHSSGDIILIASADIRVENGAIYSLLKRLASEDNIGMVDSHVLLLNPKDRFFTSITNSIWALHNITMIELNDKERLAHVAGDLYVIRSGIIKKIPEHIVNDDAYIAMVAKLKGYKVLHETSAKCYILGPQNPYDYILQRSRVLYGHFQILRYFGKPPTTFQFTIISQPHTSMTILKKAVKILRFEGILPLVIASILEVASLYYCLVCFVVFKRKPTKWKIVGSTKETF
jgi:cellulose synthase/poly-beta-1,6-N-acetylglucosamine synthase-like glycosyltransferase